jgi:cytochrome P450
MLIILHVGGHSTTTDVITTGMYHLMTQPDIYKMLEADPERVPNAIEELIRFDPPVTVATPRAAKENMEIAGTVIPAGESVYAVLASANRDPQQFREPNRIVVGRTDNKHLSFAVGSHFCLGAHLGRQEAQELLSVILRDCPRLAMATEPDDLVWQDSLPHRGLQRLPVRWCGR